MKPWTQTVAIAILLVCSIAQVRAQESSWKRMDGPWGATVTAVADDHGRSTLIAGTFDGLIFFSTDKGATWFERTIIYPFERPVEAIAVSGGGTIAIAGHQDCYHSVDGGKTWSNGGRDVTTVSDIHDAGTVTSLTYVAEDALFLTSMNGIYRSTNNGINWTRVAIDMEENRLLYSIVRVGASLLAPSPTGLYRSTDEGESWSRYNGDLPKGTMVWGVVPEGNNLFLTSSNGLFKSVDQGAGWTQISIPDVEPRRVHRVEVLDGKVIVGTLDGIYLSDDRGESWRKVSSHVINQSMVHGNSLFILMQGSLQRASSDLLQWETLEHGMHAGLYDISAYNSTLYVVTSSHVQSMNAPEGVWRRLSLPEPTPGRPSSIGRAMAAASGLYLYGRSFFSRSTDGGANWTDLLPSIPDAENSQITDVIVTDEWIIAGISAITQNPVTGQTDIISSIYKSEDGGSNWYEMSLSIEKHFLQYLTVAGDTLYAAANATDYEAGDDKLFRSTDGGNTWKQVEVEGTVTTINALYYINGSLRACSVDGLYRLNMEEKKWERDGLRRLFVRALLQEGGKLYAGTLEGMYGSHDGGRTWVEYGLADYDITNLVAMNGVVYAGAYNGELFSLSSAASSHTTRRSGAKEIGLVVYERGESDQRICGVTLPANGTVSISVVDLRGIVRGNPFTARLPEGSHDIALSIEDLESGTYLCVARSEYGVATTVFRVAR